jgi:hypothetical protein
MIPASAGPSGPAWEAARDRDPVVQEYRAFFARLDWSVVPARDPRRPWPGSPPHPPAAYVKALLVKLCEGKRYVTDLRTFLLKHPLLVLELGFRPVVDPTQPHGFDVGRTVPGARWLRHQQQTLDHAVLRALLAGTVRALAAEIPALGTTVAVDVKHLYAWVRENNPKEDVPHRFDPARQPRGDPDCRLGAKCRTNQDGRRAKEFLWGYGTGIATATDPRYGDVVLAEVTQPFNRQDVTWFHPVYDQAVAHLGRRPTNLTADAAFDAWHVYQPCAAHGGVAAIARNRRGPAPPRDAAGHPICARGRVMTPVSEGRHEDGYRAREYRCPLLRPRRTGESCDHPQFAKGPGCTKATNLEAGGRMRIDLDRTAEPYLGLYRQRTSAERINSQAKALGIERPMVRRAAAVHRLNTLTYVVINARALHRLRARQAEAHPPPPSLC